MSADWGLSVVVAVAVVMVVPAAIARRQWVLACAVSAAGGALVLQTMPVYLVVDAVLGDRNLTNLGYHLLALAAIGAFVQLLITADPSRVAHHGVRPIAVSTVVACGLEGALFAAGSASAGWGRLDPYLTEGMGEPLVVGYACVLWLAGAGLAVAMVVTQQQQTRGRPWSLARLGVSLMVVGAGAGLLWCGNAIALAIIALTGHLDQPRNSDGAVLTVVSGVAVFCGLALTTVRQLGRRVRAAALDLATRSLWRRAVAAAPEVSLGASNGASLGRRATLYRHWVEIEDARRLDRLHLTPRERGHVTAMQRMFAPTTGRPGSAR